MRVTQICMVLVGLFSLIVAMSATSIIDLLMLAVLSFIGKPGAEKPRGVG